MMKALAIFLSVYIVLLSCTACADVVQHSAFKKVQICQNTANARDGLDHCSPFCTCQCCNASFNISNNILSFFIEPLGNVYQDNTPEFISPYIFDFLIPPRA